MTVKPFFMWAGGKIKLLKKYTPIWPDMDAYDLYVEPFFGGGAVYGNLIEDFTGETIIGDVNTELMGVYSALKNHPDEFIKTAQTVAERVLAPETKDARKAEYYRQLQHYWEDPQPGTLYPLMRLGFNGIWQTNKKAAGKFATPAGLLNQKTITQVVNPEHLHIWSKHLQTTQIVTGGYTTFRIPTGKTALIYLDPPYRGSFTSYGTGFNDADQEALVAWAKQQASNGHTVLLANRHVDDDLFFENLLPEATFHYFDVTYTAGRRKRVETGSGFEAKPAREFLAVIPGR